MIRRITAICIAALSIFISDANAQKQYELVEINFEGNNTLSSAELGDAVYSEETPFFLWKFLSSFTPFGAEPVYFDSSNIEIDLKSLRQYYNVNGFFSASFSYSYDVDTTDKEAVLTYKIFEGEVSTYGGFIVTGLDSIPAYLLLEVESTMIIDSTERYQQQQVETNINSSLNILKNNGYMLSKFDSTIIFKDAASNKAYIEVFFTSGKRFSVDTILVKTEGPGADMVADDVLFRISDLDKGSLYSQERIRASQQRLFRTDLFNSINIRPEAYDSSGGNLVKLRIEGNIGELNELSPEVFANNQGNALNLGLDSGTILQLLLSV